MTNDAIEVNAGTIWLHDQPMAGLADPKDVLSEPESLVPPGPSAAAAPSRTPR
jgi:hypothetical protein